MSAKNYSAAFLLSAVLVSTSAFAYSQPSNPAQDPGAKQDLKDAGHDTKDAAKDTGHDVKHGTKKAYHKTKHATKKAWHKTENTTKGAVDGGKEGAHEPAH